VTCRRQKRPPLRRKALLYAEVASCIGAVQASAASASTKLALEFLVLTAGRSGEVREARSGEFDFHGDGELATFSDRLRAILATTLPMDRETRELQPRILSLSPEARALLVRFADEIEVQQALGGDLMHVAGYASKAAEQASRIAGVLTLWADLRAPMITAQAMAWGCGLAQFYLGEAARLADGANVSVDVEGADSLRKWLVESWPHPEVVLRDVLRLAPIRALRDRLAAKRAIATLVEAGWLVPLLPGAIVNGVPRKEAWGIVRHTG
jgi:uncharacterized protein DUF3987